MNSEKQTMPVKYEFMGSLRRTAIDVPPRMNQLRKKLAASFPEAAERFNNKKEVLRFTYVDDEGDTITISTNDELLAAYRVAQKAGKVLRFKVNEATSKTSESRSVDKTNATDQRRHGVNAADQSPVIGPYHQTSKFDSTLEEASMISSNTLNNPPLPPFSEKMPQNPSVIHWGVMCDVSGQNPIVGKRFKKIGFNYDLCEAEFNKLSSAEKSQFVCITQPLSQGRYLDWRCRLIHRPKFKSELKNAWRRQWRQHGGNGKYRRRRPNFKLIRDITAPNGCFVEKGVEFVKSWRLCVLNNPIPAHTKIVFIDRKKGKGTAGTQDEASAQWVNYGKPVAAGSEFTVSIPLKAPLIEGVVHACCRLQMVDGRRFGPKLWTSFTVIEAAETGEAKDSSSREYNEAESEAMEAEVDSNANGANENGIDAQARDDNETEADAEAREDNDAIALHNVLSACDHASGTFNDPSKRQELNDILFQDMQAGDYSNTIAFLQSNDFLSK